MKLMRLYKIIDVFSFLAAIAGLGLLLFGMQGSSLSMIRVGGATLGVAFAVGVIANILLWKRKRSTL